MSTHTHTHTDLRPRTWDNMACSVKVYSWNKSITKQEQCLRNYLVQIPS